MNNPSLSTKLLMLGAAVSAGYLLMSGYFALFPPAEKAPVAHKPPAMVDETPERIVETYSAGVDLPWEVRNQMLGLPKDTPRPERDGDDGVTNPANYSFLVAEHGHDQIQEMRDYAKTPEGQKQMQDIGLTEDNLEDMAREGRMSW